MSLELKIILSAIGVVALAFAIWIISGLRDARKLREEARRRRVQDAQREELFSPEHQSKATEDYRRMQKLRKEAGHDDQLRRASNYLSFPRPGQPPLGGE